MVSALVNGVTGGKWYSLVDKAIRPTTLDAAWHKVARNKGAAGVDGGKARLDRVDHLRRRAQNRRQMTKITGETAMARMTGGGALVEMLRRHGVGEMTDPRPVLHPPRIGGFG
jgi:hypothetical protein